MALPQIISFWLFLFFSTFAVDASNGAVRVPAAGLRLGGSYWMAKVSPRDGLRPQIRANKVCSVLRGETGASLFHLKLYHEIRNSRIIHAFRQKRSIIRNFSSCQRQHGCNKRSDSQSLRRRHRCGPCGRGQLDGHVRSDKRYHDQGSRDD